MNPNKNQLLHYFKSDLLSDGASISIPTLSIRVDATRYFQNLEGKR